MLEDAFEDIIGKAGFGKGGSLSDLAGRADLSESRISALEGGTLPRGNDVEKIAVPLDLNKEKLLRIV